jgi:hypothetical protein
MDRSELEEDIPDEVITLEIQDGFIGGSSNIEEEGD